ncbi:MAG: hypothetical protein GX651_05930 [Methanomicrobiales archaeon]|nr:hypothetical protein [Methanomicrobiales archaeon]
MDKLVAVGTAAVIGLVLAGLLVLGGVVFAFNLLLIAVVTGDWSSLIRLLPMAILFILGYLGIGLWLRKSGYT